MGYDAFMSYSHAADAERSAAVQSGLQQLAKPWYRMRAIRLFRDKTSLSANPALWPSLETALSSSRYFVLMGSPAAAQSPWVEREIDWWLSNRSVEHFLIVLTAGEIVWDDAAHDFDWTRTTALPSSLKGRFPQEPLYVDLRALTDRSSLSLRHSQFRAAMLDLASPIRGVAKDELDGDDVRQHRLTRVLASAAVLALMVFAAVAVWQAVVANARRLEAERQARIATSRALISAASMVGSNRLDLSLLLAVASFRVADTFEARQMLLSLVRTNPMLVRYYHHLFRRAIGLAISRDGTHALLGDGQRLWLRRLTDNTTVGSLETSGGFGSVALSPDGGQVVVSNGAGKVLLWTPATNTQIGLPLPAQPGRVEVAFSPGNDAVATAMVSGTAPGERELVVSLWDARSGRRQREFRQPFEDDADVRALNFSVDETLVWLGAGRAVYAWEMSTGRLAGNFPIRLKGFMVAGGFSDDNRVFAAASKDSLTVLHRSGQANQGSARAEAETIGDFEGIVDLAFTSADEVAIADGNRVLIWDVTRRQRVEELADPDTMQLLRVVSVPASHQLVSLTAEGIAMRWDRAAANPLTTPLPTLRDGQKVRRAAFSPDGRTLAVTAGSSDIHLLDVTIRQWRGVLTGHAGPVTSVTFGADGTLATAGEDGTVRFWDVQGLRAMGEPLQVDRQAVDSVSFSVDGRLLVTTGGTRFHVWRLSDRAEVPLPAALTGNHLVSGFGGSELLVSTEPAGGHGTYRLWNAATGAVSDVAEPLRAFAVLAFSPDGRWIAAPESDGIQLWDRQTQRPVGELFGGPDQVSMAFSDDSRTLIAGKFELELWDVGTRRLLGESLIGHMQTPGQTWFNRDATRMVRASDGVMTLWDFDAVTLAARACARANRELSESEWQQYAGTAYRTVCDTPGGSLPRGTAEHVYIMRP